MKDKILDDDDIIDLTDLLEEGDPKQGKEKKDTGAPVRPPAREPDSFDLGKEISMEYDVSVEEIEHGPEKLDIDASLSSNEEVALSTGKEDSGEIVLSEEPAGEVEFDFGDAGTTGREKAEESLHDFRTEKVEAASGEQASDAAFDFDAGDEIRLERGAGNDPALEHAGEFEPAPHSLEEQEPVHHMAGQGISGEIDREAAGPAGGHLAADALDEAKKEIPAMLEGIVRPIITEIARELVAATREQLPGIVEKIIREEIEKLKKLDS